MYHDVSQTCVVRHPRHDLTCTACTAWPLITFGQVTPQPSSRWKLVEAQKPTTPRGSLSCWVAAGWGLGFLDIFRSSRDSEKSVESKIRIIKKSWKMVHCRHSMSNHEIQGVPSCRRGLAGTVIKTKRCSRYWYDTIWLDASGYQISQKTCGPINWHVCFTSNSPPSYPSRHRCIAAHRKEKPSAKRRTMMVRPRPASILSFCLQFHVRLDEPNHNKSC